MITIRHPFSFPPGYPPGCLGPEDRLLFFDIETTGFSPDGSRLYLIGAVFRDSPSGEWVLIQWFADCPQAEPECLKAFLSLTREHPILVHFNGDTFDLPYLAGRARHLGLPFCLSHTESIDLFRKIRTCKKLLGLDSLKLTAVENFLGIRRTDRYSGGQLIQVYADYLAAESPARLHLLLLHNEDDLKGLCSVLPILTYPALREKPAMLTGRQLLSPEERRKADMLPEGESPLLRLQFSVPDPFPVSLRLTAETGGMILQDSSVWCFIPLLRGNLKYFFPDWQNYYYLPEEDMAIHKSVGTYVSRSARKKATAKTCYMRKKGLFLPLPAPSWTPLFRESYRDPLCYTPWEPELFSDPEKADQYLHALLDTVCNAPPVPPVPAP